MFILQTIIEIAVAVLIIWGLFNEQTLVNFEDKILDFLKRHLKASAKKRNVYRHKGTAYKNNDRSCA